MYCGGAAAFQLLKECGEDEANCDRLVEYVQLNNAALKGKGALQVGACPAVSPNKIYECIVCQTLILW